ncbi:MAG: dihydropteroate synthase [Propionibacteriaceae bacterium]|jgi:dihydropteroate synthase/2-amino-4-hydroxy-6-hydroxymethyldihydropteridine diphosphokinase/dihydroneopterin aldolase|nr:dihydropteroate synthase [Propionibacteriaceae bacterium]
MPDRVAPLLARPGTLVVGILNVTPDSFSDGGRWLDPAAAIAHGLDLAAQGAAIVDVGAESTRPGAAPISAEEEWRRLEPVVTALAGHGVTVSVDTLKAAVAAQAIAAGAAIVNDVSGGLADPAMLVTVAAAQAYYIASHWRGPLDADGSPAAYGDVVAAVHAALAERLAAATAAGIPAHRLIADPGLGFSKSAADNWALVAAAARFHDLGVPVLWGASRKRFTAELGDRDQVSTAVTAWLASQGAWAVRAHTVPDHLLAAAVGQTLRAASCTVAAPPHAPDHITLTGVRALGRHGVLPSEQRDPQPFAVDLTAELAQSSSSDDLATTADYSQLSALIADEIANHSYQLIETLAEQIAARALAIPGLTAVTVTVHKPQAPLAQEFADVAVTIRRELPVRARRAVFSLGSNLGDRAAALQFAVTGLATTPGVTLEAVSGVYETSPVGVADEQPDYLNAVAVARSTLPATALLDRALALEALAGRTRDTAPDAVQHGARTLDIDLVDVAGETCATPRLTLPHPRARRRAFVLVPWAELDPAVETPAFPDQSVRRVDGVTLWLPSRGEPSSRGEPPSRGERPERPVGEAAPR